MTSFRHTALFITLSAASLAAIAQTDADHSQHHPAEPAKKSAKETPPVPPTVKDSNSGVDNTMKGMREMHERMMAAKTPDERKALMADHMKAMQDGMAMMKKMDAMGGMAGKGSDQKNGGMSMDMMGHHDMMQKRMEMMTTMMQMMMDRLPAQ